MSPEQLESRDTNSRSDIFSFGATLYEMLTGLRAFSGDSKASLIGSIMKETPQSILDLIPTTPPALDRLIRKCLKKEPENRWQTAKDLKDELEWIASVDESIAIGGVGTRRQRPVMQIALTLLFIIASTSTFLWLKADKERERAAKGQQFLSDVLTSSFPYGYGDKTTVLDILDKASEKLNESFLDEPRIEGELRQSLGMAYGRIGRYREAKRELTSSLALYEAALGVTDDRTLNLLTDLYRLNRAMGDGDAMLNLAYKMEAAAEDRFGVDSEELFWEKTTVAYTLERKGDIDNAVATMEEAWRGFKDFIKSDTSAIIYAQIQYAWLLLKQGKHSESKRLSHEALNIATAEEESYRIRDAKSVLAASHIVLGEIDSAKALYDYRKMPETFGIERTFQGQFELADGRFQLLVFFETWCPFSQQKMARLGKIDRQYSQHGLDIIGLTQVNRGANEEEVDKYLRNLDVDFTVVKENGRSWNYFECDGTPSIRLTHDGYLVWEKRYYSDDPISLQMLEGIAAFQSDGV
jgi:tetratricopeptide (TPR) repeat protein